MEYQKKEIRIFQNGRQSARTSVTAPGHMRKE